MKSVPLPDDFKELLKFLIKHDARFLVVGGYAVAFHGHPRYTGDLDLWIERSESNARKVVAALREFGFDLPELQPELFLSRDRVVRMGAEPMRIEFFVSIPGVTFSDCDTRREVLEIGGLKIPFISLEDLRTNKRVSGRPVDLGDLDELSQA